MVSRFTVKLPRLACGGLTLLSQAALICLAPTRAAKAREAAHLEVQGATGHARKEAGQLEERKEVARDEQDQQQRQEHPIGLCPGCDRLHDDVRHGLAVLQSRRCLAGRQECTKVRSCTCDSRSRHGVAACTCACACAVHLCTAGGVRMGHAPKAPPCRASLHRRLDGQTMRGLMLASHGHERAPRHRGTAQCPPQLATSRLPGRLCQRARPLQLHVAYWSRGHARLPQHLG